MVDMQSKSRRRLGEDLRGWRAFHAALPAVVTYALSALGLQLTGTSLGEWVGEPPTAFEALLMVTTLTVSHGLLVAGLFGLARRSFRGMGGFGLWLPLAVLYGVPVFVLAWETGWLCLVGATVHWVMAPRETRTWTAIEYGSSSFCLMLFLLVYEGGLFPLGLLALAFQVAVLLLMHLTVRHLWVAAPAAEPTGDPSAPRAST